MYLSPSRPAAARAARRLFLSALACSASLGALSASPALASEGSATCEGQAFSQPFAALGDFNYYTLVSGSQFNSAEEGWQLTGGAHIAQSNRPEGSTGGVLELPPGAEAISPPECVTLQYPTARTYARRTEGEGRVRVAVAYANMRTARQVALLWSKAGSWRLSEPFDIRPELGGLGEEARQVRFIFSTNEEHTAVYDVYSVYVDPRMY